MANVFVVYTNGTVSYPQGVTDEDDCITVLAGNATIVGGLGNDKIITLIGNNIIYGDLSSVTISAVAGVDTPVTGGNVSATYGNDCVFAGLSNDIVIGDVGDILLRAKAGTVLTVLNADATLQNVSLTMGTDMLYGSLGKDDLFGDVRNLTLESLGGTANNPAPTINTANSFMLGITFLGGIDYLYGGEGNDNLYGDIGTLNFLAKGGDALGAGDRAIARIQGNILPNSLKMGGDFLSGDSGNDTLYGDIGAMNLTVQGGTTNGELTSPGLVSAGNTFEMGADQLIAGDGDDKLIGDIGALNLKSLAGLGSYSQMGATFMMGNDTLDGGNGADVLWGDVASLEISGKSGTVSGVNFLAYSVAGSLLTMGKDTLIGGAGNDVLYGDMGTYTHSWTGGTITNTSIQEDVEVESGAGGGLVNLNIAMGSDILLSGGSGNDVIYGDVGTLNLSLTGGVNNGISTLFFGATAFLIDGIITMGDDLLQGESGNDQLYGDLGAFSVTLINGTGVGTETAINNTKIQFGSDTLIGGSGDDVLVGDIANPAQLSGFLNAPLDPIPPVPSLPNQLIFGNDTFQFSLGGSNGKDVVKDMNVGAVSTATAIVTNVMDTLKFTDVMNVNGGALDYTDVDAQSVFSNSGGHVKMSFAGGSVLFENINWAEQDSVLDITPNVVVI